MATIRDWNVTASANTGAASAGWMAEGMSYANVNNAYREGQAIISRWVRDANGALIAGGSTSSYVLSINQSLGSYSDGDRFAFQANVKNAGATTLQVSTLSARPVVRTNLAPLQDGDIVAGGVYEVAYISASAGGNFQLLNPSTFPSDTLIPKAGTGIVIGGSTSATLSVSFSYLGIQTLTDPGADSIAIWDDSASAFAFATVSTGLQMVSATGSTYLSAVLATTAETLTGTDVDRALTPGGFAATKSLAASGYYKFPGGLMIQWGNVSVGSDSSAAVTFPLAFSTACYSVSATKSQGSAGNNYGGSVTSLSTTGMTVWNDDGSTRTYYWIAIGV